MRENQRKSRARKQQYIEELEQKVAVCNAQAQQREIEHLIAFQKLEAENAKLRSLLHSVGLTPDFLDGFLKDESSPTATEKIAIPRLKPAISSQSLPGQCVSTTNTIKSCPPSSLETVDNFCAKVSKCQGKPCTPSTAGLSEPSGILPVTPADPVATPQQSLPSNKQTVRLPPIASLCDCGPESITKWPRLETSSNTTLCEVAEDLISQYNIQGVDINAIKQRLWRGFRNGGENSGCRVQNNVLFEVLDEISGDISMAAGT